MNGSKIWLEYKKEIKTDYRLVKYDGFSEANLVLQDRNKAKSYVILTQTEAIYLDGNLNDMDAKTSYLAGVWAIKPTYSSGNLHIYLLPKKAYKIKFFVLLRETHKF